MYICLYIYISNYKEIGISPAATRPLALAGWLGGACDLAIAVRIHDQYRLPLKWSLLLLWSWDFNLKLVARQLFHIFGWIICNYSCVTLGCWQGSSLVDESSLTDPHRWHLCTSQSKYLVRRHVGRSVFVHLGSSWLKLCLGKGLARPAAFLDPGSVLGVRAGAGVPFHHLWDHPDVHHGTPIVWYSPG